MAVCFLKKGCEQVSKEEAAAREKALSTFIKLENQYELLDFKNCNELVVFAAINSFCKSHGYYSGGYSYLSKHFPISHKTAIRTIKSLVDKKYIIEIPGRYNTTNKYKPNTEYLNELLGYGQNGYTQIDYSQNVLGYGQNDQSSMVKMTTSKNIIRDSKNKEEVVEEQTSTAPSSNSHHLGKQKQSIANTPEAEQEQHSQPEQSEQAEHKEEPARSQVSEILMMYRENICMANKRYQLTPIEIENLKKLIDEHSADRVKAAIKRAVERSRFDIGYIKGILNSWQKNGYDDGKAPAPAKQQQAEQRGISPTPAQKPHRQKPTLDF